MVSSLRVCLEVYGLWSWSCKNVRVHITGYDWISIVVSATVVAVALSLLEWNSPFGLNPWGRKRKTNYTLGSGLNMVYAILFQHTIKTKSPKAWPSKWLQNFWAGASIFIYSSYTANLAAFLAGKNAAVAISSVYDPQASRISAQRRFIVCHRQLCASASK